MPINNLESYIEGCLEEKDYYLYQRIENNLIADAFFNKIEEVYFNNLEKYKEEFISTCMKLKNKLHGIEKQQQEKTDELKAHNILIHEDFNFGEFYLGKIMFTFDNLYNIKFTEEEIQYIQNYVEKNKRSNMPVILKSPAEIKYEEISINLANLKNDLEKYTKRRKTYEKLRLSRANQHLSMKITEINDYIDSIIQTKERKECFDKITLEQFELIYDYLNLENQYLETHAKWTPLSMMLHEVPFPMMKFNVFCKTLKDMMEEEKITSEEIEKVMQIVCSDTKKLNNDNENESSLFIFPNRLVVINLFSAYLRINGFEEKHKTIQKTLKRS